MKNKSYFFIFLNFDLFCMLDNVFFENALVPVKIDIISYNVSWPFRQLHSLQGQE